MAQPVEVVRKGSMRKLSRGLSRALSDVKQKFSTHRAALEEDSDGLSLDFLYQLFESNTSHGTDTVLPQDAKICLSDLRGSGHLGEQDEAAAVERLEEVAGSGPLSFEQFVQVVTNKASAGMNMLKHDFDTFPRSNHAVAPATFLGAVKELAGESAHDAALEAVGNAEAMPFSLYIECSTLYQLAGVRVVFCKQAQDENYDKGQSEWERTQNMRMNMRKMRDKLNHQGESIGEDGDGDGDGGDGAK